MARVLIAWELGEAYGHLVRCLRLAERLHQRGHELVLALKDVRLPISDIDMSEMAVVPAPLTPQKRIGRMPPINYADLLRYCGFANEEDIAARLTAWQGVFSLARPDIVISDHAPTVQLGASISGIQFMAIGNGFTIPPDKDPWPSIRPWEDISDNKLLAKERELNLVTEAAQSKLGCVKPVSMRDLFSSHDMLDTFAELDHYGARTNMLYSGPIFSVPHVRTVNWKSNKGTKILVYLRPEVPGFKEIIRALSSIDAEVLCVTPGLAPNLARQLATRRLRISLSPLDLSQLLLHADLAVSYGSSGFVTQSLLAGVPLLMFPKHVEQALFALRVEEMGAGKLFNSQLEEKVITEMLREVLHNQEYRQAAKNFQESYRHFTPEHAVELNMTAIEQKLSDG